MFGVASAGEHVDAAFFPPRRADLVALRRIARALDAEVRRRVVHDLVVVARPRAPRHRAAPRTRAPRADSRRALIGLRSAPRAHAVERTLRVGRARRLPADRRPEKARGLLLRVVVAA